MAEDTAEKSQWTIETLRLHILALMATNDAKYSERFQAQQTAMEAALTAQKLAVDTALSAADRAVLKSEVAAEKRFESVNEFRASLADQQRTLMPRSESELLIRGLSEKVDAHAQVLQTSAGQKSGIKDGWLYLVGGVSVLSLIASFALHFIK